jgi:hypothetical protein
MGLTTLLLQMESPMGTMSLRHWLIVPVIVLLIFNYRFGKFWTRRFPWVD